ARLKELLGDRAMQLEQHERDLANWRARVHPIRERFHGLVAEAAEAQWQLGPQLLVELEKAATQQRIWVRSIPWDPPRMIGWKLVAHGINLQLIDVEAAVREIS